MGSAATCYTEAMARRYDRDYRAIGRLADIEHYVALARQARGPVLELGCGTGRVLLPMARAGATVTGVDPSEAMRRVLLGKLSAESEDVRGRVTVLSGDFLHLPAAGPFALVVAPFRSLQHLGSEHERLAALRAMRAALVPGGLLAFDVFDFDPAIAARAAAGQVDCAYEAGGVRHERRSRAVHDAPDALLRVRLQWFEDGDEVAHMDCSMGIVTRAEIERLLPRAGLALRALSGDFDGSPHDPGRPRELVVVAERRPPA